MSNAIHKKINDIQPNDFIEGCYALRHYELRSYSGKPYIVMELGDSSGRIKAVYWGEDSDMVSRRLEIVPVVRVEGVGNEYKGKCELKLDLVAPAEDDDYKLEEFLPTGERPREELEEELKDTIEIIENKHLAKLLKIVFIDENIHDKFMKWPAGKLWHGAYLGGLAEHSINVAKICQFAAKFYKFCRKDLLITGALLHDIGKIEEFQVSSHFDYSVSGRLNGHIVIGDKMISRIVGSIENFPNELGEELSHMILSHHGETEFGSPVKPMTIEAIILHFADCMDSQANAYSHIVEKYLDSNEPFSSWIRPIERYLYLEGYRSDSE